MKFTLISFAIFATALAGGSAPDAGKTCKSDQTVVCSKNGGGGLISLGNIAGGALGVECSGGDVYCCDKKDVDNIGLVNLDVNAQCSLNHLL